MQRWLVVLTLALLASPALAEAPSADEDKLRGIGPWGGLVSVQFQPRPGPLTRATPDLPLVGFPIELFLDDGISEGETGVNGAGAIQFLWLNAFAPPGGVFELEEIWVLFAPGANMAVGNAVDLVVYSDNDGDPSNGATLLATISETIQALDGSFSMYPLMAPVTVPAGDFVLIGVIPRFINTGTTSPTFPASVDTTASQGNSWLITWSGDPPASPTLPSDDTATTTNGNWMIRGFGQPSTTTTTPVIDVPTLGSAGLLGLVGLLAVAAMATLRRRPSR